MRITASWQREQKMNQLNQIKQKLNQNMDRIKQKYQIKQLGIFGSYIRDEATPNSDLDILVEFEPQARFGLLTFCELENYLGELLAVKVDLVMKDGLKPQIGQNILKEVDYLWIKEKSKIIYKTFWMR